MAVSFPLVRAAVPPMVEPQAPTLSMARPPVAEQGIPREGASRPSPFFIVGSARSGTTLLSMLLSRHPRIEVLAETNFYPIFQPLRACYEPLSDPRSLARFADEVAGLARHIVPFPLGAKEILARVEQPTFPGVFKAWLDAYAGHYGKERSGEKTPQHCRYVETIERDFPGASILIVVRDPRDSAYSGLRSFGRSLCSMAADWNAVIPAVQTARGRRHLVRYEELVAAPEAALRGICDQLGEAWDAAMLDPERTSPFFRGSHRGHERLKERVDVQSIGRFRALEESRIAWIERECAEGMRLLGYEPVASAASSRLAEGTRGTSSPDSHKGLLGRADWTRRLFHWRLRLRSHLWRWQRTA